MQPAILHAADPFCQPCSNKSIVPRSSACRQAVSLLRGFFWTTSPRSMFVMVTDQGLEMYSLKVGWSCFWPAGCLDKAGALNHLMLAHRLWLGFHALIHPL